MTWDIVSNIFCNMWTTCRTGNVTEVRKKFFLHHTEKKAATLSCIRFFNEIELTLRDDRWQFGQIFIKLLLSSALGQPDDKNVCVTLGILKMAFSVFVVSTPWYV